MVAQRHTGRNVGSHIHNKDVSVLSPALAYKRLLNSDSALGMLRADNLPVMAAVLGAHLGRPGVHVPTDTLHELIDTDLEELRDHFDLGNRTAKAYCDDWRHKGVLIRRPASDVRGEVYELSAAGFDAIRIIEQLHTPPKTATESRLVSLSQALRRLAIETDPDSSRRLEALEAEKARIDEEIQRLREADPASQVLDTKQAIERTLDILQQVQGLPTDFARVRARFQELNHELRMSVLISEDSQSAVLDEIFRGVDLIASSDEGRTFEAFAALLRDPELAAALNDDILQILDRKFARELDTADRQALRSLMSDMKAGAGEVTNALSEFARGLRNYVYSREFQRDRAMLTLTREAFAQAAELSTRCKPTTDIGLDLELSALPMSSVGELSLHDPEEYITGAELSESVPHDLDFETLVAAARETEIDMTELVRNVNCVLDQVAEASVADVLSKFPATQGLASVIGLLSLSFNYGAPASEEPAGTPSEETAVWQGTDGIDRTATIPRYIFTEEINL